MKFKDKFNFINVIIYRKYFFKTLLKYCNHRFGIEMPIFIPKSVSEFYKNLESII